MAGISPMIIAMVVVSVIAQVAAMSLLPMTKGLTQPLPTLAAAVCLLFGVGMIARIAYSGVNLSTIVPIMSAIVPVCAIGVGIVFYGEVASMAKVATLVTACALIGVANLL